MRDQLVSRPDIDGVRWIRLTEMKGEGRVMKEHDLPLLPVLQEALDACPSGHLTWLVTSFGKPYLAGPKGGRALHPLGRPPVPGRAGHAPADPSEGRDQVEKTDDIMAEIAETGADAMNIYREETAAMMRRTRDRAHRLRALW